MDYFDYNINFTDFDGPADPCILAGNCTDFTEDAGIGGRHWFVLVCYSLVFLLGVPGNGLVVWVTAFKMPRSVNAIWFLHLALADLLCCLSMPLLMVSLAMDKHWPFGAEACKLMNGLIYMLMYCSVLLLMLISLDRWLLVSQPAWCQNWRQPRWAHWVCLSVWVLALLGTIPQFIHMTIKVYEKKVLCIGEYGNMINASAMVAFRFVLGFLLPFFIICTSHWTVYQRASRNVMRRQNDRSARTLRVIMAVVISFFMCWIPLHIVDLLQLINQNHKIEANLHMAQALALCLAYFNSCLNPLLYVCLGRGFRENITKSLRSIFHFTSEEPSRGPSVNTKSTTESNILAMTTKSIK